jgi:CubicO group peptidase (beta-lactamase class C family)
VENYRWPGLADYYADWLRYRQWYLRTPGVQAAVRRRGELVLSIAAGLADVDSGRPLTEQHLFRIASHSKSFASVSVLQLVARGALRLDDRIGTVVAELADSPLAQRTVRDLLTHSGGVIRDSEDGDFWQHTHPFPNRDELIAIANRPAAAVLPRSEHYKYSNIAFGLIGLAIEAVSGKSFPDWLHEEIASPLHLADTGGELDPARADQYAAAHSGLSTARERRVVDHVDTHALAAATGCYSTARDLTAFYSALLPGDTRLLDDDTKREQRHRHWDTKSEGGYGYGLILNKIDDVDVYGHSGGYPGHITCTHAEVDDGWVVSVLTNAIDGPAGSLAEGFFRLLALGRKARHKQTDDAAVKFTGRFSSLWGVADVVRVDGRLFMLSPTVMNPAEDAIPLEVLDDTTLKMVGGSGGNSYGEAVPYEFDESGAVLRLRGNSGVTMTPFRHDAIG